MLKNENGSHTHMQVYTREQLETMSLRQIADHYNALAFELQEKLVNKFGDRKAAVRRTLELQDRYSGKEKEADGAEVPQPQSLPEQVAEVTTKVVQKKLAERKRRGPYFVFKPAEAQREPKAGSRRRTAFDMLRRPEGATQAEIEAACSWNGRQAYEAIRLMHYMHGYGLRFVDQAGGRVQAYTKDEEHPVVRS